MLAESELMSGWEEDIMAMEDIIAAVEASGCSSIAHFLASPHCHANSILVGDPSDGAHHAADTLFISGRFLEAEKPPGSGSIMRALCAIPTCRDLVLSNLRLTPYQLSELCHGLASSDCTLHSLSISRMIIRSMDSAAPFAPMELSEALLKNASLQSLSIVDSIPVTNYEKILTGLAQNTLSLSRLMLGSQILSISIKTMDYNIGRVVGEMIQTNTSLTHLGILNSYLAHDGFRMLFTSLEKNLHLTSLSLSYCQLTADSSWDSTLVLDSLQANGILSELDLTGTPSLHI